MLYLLLVTNLKPMVNIMKTTKLIRHLFIIAIAALAVTGCITSVHPLFTDQELIYKPELEGAWNNSDETLIFSGKSKTFLGHDKTFYSIQYVENSDTTQLIGRLGKLGGQYFLDMTIDDNDPKVKDLIGLYVFPVHIFFKISFANDKISMNSFALSSDWLDKLIRERRIRIDHEIEQNQILLTASTEELQKFVIKYENEPKAFEDQPTQFHRVTTK